jgi:hypothetical protein
VLLDEGDRAGAETRVREAMTGTGIGGLVRLRPDPTVVSTVPPVSSGSASTAPATQPLLPRRVSGFGQMFENVPPGQLVAASQWITCWGNGLVNARRAPEAALKLATPLTGVEIAALLRAREGATPGGLVKAANIKPRGELHLTESSACHSLWIITRTNRRDWHYFTVLDESDESSPGIVSFVW